MPVCDSIPLVALDALRLAGILFHIPPARTLCRIEEHADCTTPGVRKATSNRIRNSMPRRDSASKGVQLVVANPRRKLSNIAPIKSRVSRMAERFNSKGVV
jgi:hypothetical protein